MKEREIKDEAKVSARASGKTSFYSCIEIEKAVAIGRSIWGIIKSLLWAWRCWVGGLDI